MKHTREQLDGMSDSEINKRIMVLLGYELSNWLNDNFGHYKHGESTIAKVIDYCQKWESIMPLAVEHGITLKRVACPAGSGFAHYAESYCGLYHTDYIEPPQRAIACCLIMVLESKDEHL